MVCVDRYYERLAVDCALFNDEETGHMLTQMLINKGHRRIAFILTNEPHVSSVRNRLEGYRKALMDAGIGFDDQLILDIYCDTSTQTHQALLQQIENLTFTAVFTANDPTTEMLLFDLIRLNHERLKAISSQST